MAPGALVLYTIGVAQRFIQYWQIAKTLSGTSVVLRSVLFITVLSIPIRKKLLGHRPIAIRMTYRGTPFTFSVRDAADIAVLHEIFVDGEYEIELSKEPQRIVDIGAHIGTTAIYFSCVYGSASIVSYEPDPDNFALLRKNTAAFPRVTVINAAVSGTGGEVVLFKNASSISSSLRDREGTVQQIRIPSRTLAEVVAGGVDLVKFDVEGEEYRMFSGSDAIRRSHSYLGELHYDLIDATPEDMRRVFSGFEFKERPLSQSRSIMSAILR